MAEKKFPGVYSGPISTVSGPPLGMQPWDPATVTEAEVGSTTITFTDGNHASFAYTANGISQTKAIERQAFMEPGTACQ